MNKDRAHGALKPIHYSFCGAFSGFVTRAVAQPLDVLKIRFQLQTEPIRKKSVNGKSVASKYYGLIQAAKLIAKEEGVAALWKGHVPAQALSLVYGGVLFVTFEGLQKVRLNNVLNKQRDSKSASANFLFGGLAGTAATLCCHPLDVIRTRFVAQGEPKVYRGLVHGVRLMAMEGGIFTFYKGLVPTVMGVFPNSSLQFGLYHLFKTFWVTHFAIKDEESGKLESLSCGALSGVFSKVLLLPFDVVKKRLQIQGFEEARKPFGRVSKYTGMIDCSMRIAVEEGIMGFYKGTAASVIKDEPFARYDIYFEMSKRDPISPSLLTSCGIDFFPFALKFPFRVAKKNMNLTA